MIKIDILWIIGIIVYVLAFIIELLCAYLSTSKEIKKYSPTNSFPSEIVTRYDKGYLFKISNYIFSAASLLILVIIIINKEAFGGMFTLSVVIAALIALTHLSSISLINISIFYVKQHAIISTIFMALTFLISALTTFYCFYMSYLYSTQSTGSSFHLSLGIISGVFTLITLLFMFNPKLKSWAKLEKVGEDVELTYARPKYFPLAYTEWIMIVLSFVSGLIYIISLINI